MCAMKHRIGEPYTLAGDRMVFTDWRYILPPSFSWRNTEGIDVNVTGTEGPLDAFFAPRDSAWGIRITARPAERTGPILTPEPPWEADGINLFTVLEEDGIYKAWGSTGWGDLNIMDRQKGSRVVCYYESTDGFNWSRPNCGLVEYAGSRNNNIADLLPGRYFNLWGSVFIDEDAAPAERYKFAVSDCFTEEECRQYLRNRPNDTDALYDRRDAGLQFGVRGAVSPDGLRWTLLQEPLVLMHEDGPETFSYDAVQKKYVAYWRDWAADPQTAGANDPLGTRWLRSARRAIGRSETSDFRRFPLSQLVMEPDPLMPPSQVYYTQCKTLFPHAPDHHLMFPSVWDTATDTTHIEMSASRDSLLWYKLSQAPVLHTNTSGQWDGGCVFAVPNLLELPGGDYALPYVGFDVPHKYPRVQAKKATGYAIWPKGRLAALEAEEGGFTTVCFIPPGNEIRINAVTARSGYILIEALNEAGQVLPGCSFEEAVPMFGDLYGAPVRWKNRTAPDVRPGEALALRVHMKQAALYSLDFTQPEE